MKEGFEGRLKGVCVCVCVCVSQCAAMCTVDKVFGECVCTCLQIVPHAHRWHLHSLSSLLSVKVKELMKNGGVLREQHDHAYYHLPSEDNTTLRKIHRDTQRYTEIHRDTQRGN